MYIFEDFPFRGNRIKANVDIFSTFKYSGISNIIKYQDPNEYE